MTAGHLRSELKTTVGSRGVPVTSNNSAVAFVGKLSIIVNSVSTVVGLAEHNIVALLLTSDNEMSNLVITSAEDTILIKTEVESHIRSLTILFIPSRPNFRSVHGELKISLHALKTPLSSNDTTLESASVVDGVLAVILLDELDITVW